jgi:hypothetical protein
MDPDHEQHGDDAEQIGGWVTVRQTGFFRHGSFLLPGSGVLFHHNTISEACQSPFFPQNAAGK